MSERCNYLRRSGARCQNPASENVTRPTNDGHVARPETVTLGYCARHAEEIVRLVGGRIER